jgi:serine/threonine kinase 19
MEEQRKRLRLETLDKDIPARAAKKRTLLLQSQRNNVTQRNDVEKDEEFDNDTIPPYVDTLSVIIFLKDLLSQRFPPLVFLDQIYVLLKNRTQVDREIETLIQQKQIIQFKLGYGSHSVALMLFRDYEHQLTMTEQHHAIFGKFLRFLKSHHLTPTLDGPSTMNEMDATDQEMTLLVNYGFLAVHDERSFWMGVPNAGSLLSQLTKGRSEMCQCLKRRSFQEMLECDIMKKTFKHILLDLRYILLYMEGIGSVESNPSTSGTIYRLKVT